MVLAWFTKCTDVLSTLIQTRVTYALLNVGIICCQTVEEEDSPHFPPKYSVVAGYDFGNWRNIRDPLLEELTLTESIVIARVHTHMTMLKLFVTKTPQRDPIAPAQHAFSGHIISMEHDRQRVFLNNYPKFKRYYVGYVFWPQGHYWCGCADVSAFLQPIGYSSLTEWLEQLRQFHPLYANIQILDLNSIFKFNSETYRTLSEIPNSLVDNALHVINEDDIRREFTTSLGLKKTAPFNLSPTAISNDGNNENTNNRRQPSEDDETTKLYWYQCCKYC
jgi:hypothetical protein